MGKQVLITNGETVINDSFDVFNALIMSGILKDKTLADCTEELGFEVAQAASRLTRGWFRAVQDDSFYEPWKPDKQLRRL